MIHGPWFTTLNSVGALCLDILSITVRASTVRASHVGQGHHHLPLNDKDGTLRRSMTLHSRDVQQNCSCEV